MRFQLPFRDSPAAREGEEGALRHYFNSLFGIQQRDSDPGLGALRNISTPFSGFLALWEVRTTRLRDFNSLFGIREGWIGVKASTLLDFNSLFGIPGGWWGLPWPCPGWISTPFSGFSDPRKPGGSSGREDFNSLFGILQRVSRSAKLDLRNFNSLFGILLTYLRVLWGVRWEFQLPFRDSRDCRCDNLAFLRDISTPFSGFSPNTLAAISSNEYFNSLFGIPHPGACARIPSSKISTPFSGFSRARWYRHPHRWNFNSLFGIPFLITIFLAKIWDFNSLFGILVVCMNPCQNYCQDFNSLFGILHHSIRWHRSVRYIFQLPFRDSPVRGIWGISK